MFTDMVSFSALAQRDERLALELLEEQRRLLRPLFASHGGDEIKSTGDGFLVEFASAVEGARCAVKLQEVVTTRNAETNPDRRFQIRIGLHVGDVVFDENDVHGDGVNIASRVQACAPPGGITLTEAAAQQVGNKLDYPVVRIGSRRLKNIGQPVTLYRVAAPWDTEAVAAARRRDRWWGRVNWQRAALGAMAAALIAGLIAWWATRAPAPVAATGVRSLAVLPLDNLSNDPGQAYFVEGMQDALINELAQISQLHVISRTSTLKYKEVQLSVPQIGHELKVDALVEGSVLKAGDRVRVTVQLISTATDQHLWSRSYERELQDVLALQSEIAREIAREIRVKLTPQERTRLAEAKAVDPEAHEAYLRGRWYRDQGSAEDLEKAYEYFQRALAADPDYAAAYAGIATYWSVLPFYSQRSPAVVFPRAKEAALKALELDETLAEAHAALAYIDAYYEWDWAGAEREFRRAIELSPSFADAHFSYSRFLAAQKRFGEAHAELASAYALDPLSLLLKANVALLSYFERDYDRSLEILREVLDIDPELSVAHWGLGLIYEQKGRYAEAILEMERAASVSGPNVRSSLGHLYGVAGKRAKAQTVLDELNAKARETYMPAYFFALIYTGLGDHDQAFNWLEKAYQERSSVLAYLQVDPRLDPLRADPRYEALRRRLRFP